MTISPSKNISKKLKETKMIIKVYIGILFVAGCLLPMVVEESYDMATWLIVMAIFLQQQNQDNK